MLGLVQSLNRPGGNLMGVASLVDETGLKRVELVRELLPSHPAIAFLVNPANPAAVTQSASVQSAARTLGQTVHTLSASNEGEIDTAFERLLELKPGALLVVSDPPVQYPPRTSRRPSCTLLLAGCVSLAGVRNSRGADELWNEPAPVVSASGHLRRSYPERRTAREFACPAVHSGRACRELENRQGARSDISNHTARSR